MNGDKIRLAGVDNMKNKLRILLISILAVMSLSACAGEGIPLPTPTPEPKEKRVSFLACGDNIIYKGTVSDAKSLATDGGYDFKPICKNVGNMISGADISFINQETLMCGDGYELSYYPMFNSPQKVGEDLAEVGFDVINISNNHMLDKGKNGLLRTIDFWETQDVLMIGGYRGRADFENLRIIEKDGIKIAFLSFTEMTNGMRVKESEELFIPYIDEENIQIQLAVANARADFSVVSLHWGDEGAFVPNKEQKRIAQLIADCGGDVILGHHPHVIQPIEWLSGMNGNRTLCAYSLGNFAAEQAYDYNMVGGMLELDFVETVDGVKRIENAVFNPTVYHFNARFRDNSVHLIQNYSEELAAKHGVRMSYGHTISYERLLKYATDTIAPEFLTDKLK